MLHDEVSGGKQEASLPLTSHSAPQCPSCLFYVLFHRRLVLKGNIEVTLVFLKKFESHWFFANHLKSKEIQADAPKSNLLFIWYVLFELCSYKYIHTYMCDIYIYTHICMCISTYM